MGCDIHFHVEVKKDESWREVQDELSTCFSCKGKGVNEGGHWNPEAVGKPCYWCHGTGKRQEAFYHGRNYKLFAVLANVRNYDEAFKPIAMPRGVPSDSDPSILGKHTEMDLDAHSATHLTVKELLDFDWGKVSEEQRGIVSSAEYLHWWKERNKKGSPGAWSGGVGGGGVQIITNEEMEKGLEDGTIKPTGLLGDPNGKSYYTQISWKQTYRDSIGENWFEVLEKMKKLDPNPENIRAVMWFDN